MGADKNSSPRRELSICPKFTTKDSHTSLPRSRSHSGPTNLRSKPQKIPKRKHNSRSKVPSNPAQCQEDGLQAWGGCSTDTGRTVCYPRADSLLIATEPPDAHPETRTVREQLVSRGQSAIPRWKVWPAHGRSGTPTRTVRQTSRRKTLTPRKIYTWAHKNWTNTRRTCTSRTVRRLWADSPPALEQNSPRWKLRSQPPLSDYGSPKWLELLRKDLGKMWSVPRGCYAPKAGSSNELNRWESNRHQTQPKT
jgi:hypothetical protein